MNKSVSAIERGFIKRATDYGLSDKEASNLLSLLRTVGRGAGKAMVPLAAGAGGVGLGLGYGSANVGNKLYDKLVFQNHLPERLDSITSGVQNATDELNKTMPAATHTFNSVNNILDHPLFRPLAIASVGGLAAYPFYQAYSDYKSKKISQKQNDVLEKMLHRLK